MQEILDAITAFLGTTGIAKLIAEPGWWQYLVMYIIIGALFYLAIVKKFEPLLLMPIAFGMLLANLPGANLIHLEYFFDDYYVSVVDGELTGTLAREMESFLYYLDQYSGSGYLPDGLYTISETALTFNFSTLADAQLELVETIFHDLMGNMATLEDGALHIKSR